MPPVKTYSNLRSLALFLLTLAFATWQSWTAADVAWSMWVASLIGGYIIMMIIGVSAASNVKKSDLPDNKLHFAIGFVFLVIFGLFNVAFLFLHFTGFHVGHAMALSALLPPSQIDVQAIEMPARFFRQLLLLYWPFAILVIIHTIFKMRESPDKINIMTPYVSVIKNHFLIFILAGLQVIQTPALVLYILLFYYFFPVRDSWALLKSTMKRLAA